MTSKDTLIVGDSADLQAEVSVGTLILSGRFKGNIKAVTRVELRAPAQVEGTIETPALSVEDGVLFTGSSAVGQALTRATLAQPGKLLALELGGKNGILVLADAGPATAQWSGKYSLLSSPSPSVILPLRSRIVTPSTTRSSICIAALLQSPTAPA